MCVQVTQKHNWFGLSRGGCNDNPPCGYGLHISYLMYRVGPWNWALEVSPSLFWTVESYPCSSSGTSCPFENFFSNRWKRTSWCTTFFQESMNRELHGFMQTHYLWSFESLEKTRGIVVLHMHAICMTSRKIHKQCYTERLPTRDAKSRPAFISANESPLYWFAVGQTRVYLIGPCFASCFFLPRFSLPSKVVQCCCSCSKFCWFLNVAGCPFVMETLGIDDEWWWC